MCKNNKIIKVSINNDLKVNDFNFWAELLPEFKFSSQVVELLDTNKVSWPHRIIS